MSSRRADVPNQPRRPEDLEQIIGDVDFPPKEALVGRALAVVVVVMPALAKGDDGDQQVIAAIVGRGVMELAFSHHSASLRTQR